MHSLPGNGETAHQEIEKGYVLQTKKFVFWCTLYAWMRANCYLFLCFGFSRKQGKIVVRWNMPCQLFFFLMKDPSSLSTPCNVCHVLHAVSEPSDLLTFFRQIKVWCNFPWVSSDTASFWSHQSCFMMTRGTAAELPKFSFLSDHCRPRLSGKSKLPLERVSLTAGK